jgi:hypothetical protein
MNRKAVIIYYLLLLFFVGLISLPTKYNSPLYGQRSIIYWSMLILIIHTTNLLDSFNKLLGKKYISNTMQSHSS